jgi:hypothetical protein
MRDFFENLLKMKTMEDKVLTVNDIPEGYALCFNNGCADKDKCMHYQAMLLTSADRFKGNAVYPTAWQDGKCRCYREKKLVKKAWGFSSLYKNVDRRDRAEARRYVSSYFGRGNGPYYRAHHGEITLSPKQQEDILKIVANFGPIDGIKFDGYKIDWDFE